MLHGCGCGCGCGVGWVGVLCGVNVGDGEKGPIECGFWHGKCCLFIEQSGQNRIYLIWL